MKKSAVALVLGNLILGNLILYFEDCTFFSGWFSISAILILLVASRFISGKLLKLKAVLLSLLVTLLIPLFGFWISSFSQALAGFSPEVLKSSFLFLPIFGMGALFFAWDKFLIMFTANLLLFLLISRSKAGSPKGSPIISH